MNNFLAWVGTVHPFCLDITHISPFFHSPFTSYYFTLSIAFYYRKMTCRFLFSVHLPVLQKKVGKVKVLLCKASLKIYYISKWPLSCCIFMAFLCLTDRDGHATINSCYCAPLLYCISSPVSSVAFHFFTHSPPRSSNKKFSRERRACTCII